MLAIVGPTASGKTELGLQYAREQNGEIISVDSRQVYRYLSIGTAKPPPSDVPYHLIDFLEPSEAFTAAQFAERASILIKDIQARGKHPILVGGTGFYFRALLEGLAPLPPADESVRARLQAFAEQEGRPALHARLADVDPQAAAKIPANNIHRVIRALEVFEVSGRPLSEWHAEHQQNKPAAREIEVIGLDPERDVLEKRIADRSRWMLKHGMIEETKALLKKGFLRQCPAFTGLGYPRVLDYLDGKLSSDELLALLIQDTRQYAKRQRTWFRHQMKVQWKK